MTLFTGIWERWEKILHHLVDGDSVDGIDVRLMLRKILDIMYKTV